MTRARATGRRRRTGETFAHNLHLYDSDHIHTHIHTHPTKHYPATVRVCVRVWMRSYRTCWTVLCNCRQRERAEASHLLRNIFARAQCAVLYNGCVFFCSCCGIVVGTHTHTHTLPAASQHVTGSGCSAPHIVYQPLMSVTRANQPTYHHATRESACSQILIRADLQRAREHASSRTCVSILFYGRARAGRGSVAWARRTLRAAAHIAFAHSPNLMKNNG